jgi:hypothetical protein
LPERIGDTIDRIAALGAGLMETDLADALEDFDLDALWAGPARKPRTVCDAQPIASAM